MTDDPSSSQPPLAPQGGRKGWWKRLPNDVWTAMRTRRSRVVELRAQGHTVPAIADALAVSVPTINRDLADPEVKADIAALRAKIKDIIMERTANKAIIPMMEMAEEMALTRNPKGLDATWRAIHAAEKTTMSASGEAQRIHVEQTPAPTAVDVRVLIQQILGAPQ